MPNPLNAVAVPNTYTDACSIQDIFGGRGGSFTVFSQPVFYQLQYGVRGATFWTEEAQLAAGAGSIEPGAIGVRFRNAGVIAASVNARISPPNQPGLMLSAFGSPGGLVTGSATLVYPGGSPSSNTLAVTHGLGAVPAAVVVSGGLCPTTSQAAAFRVFSLTATQFSVDGAEVNGANQAGNQTIYWVAST